MLLQRRHLKKRCATSVFPLIQSQSDTWTQTHIEYLQLKPTALVHDIIELSLEGKYNISRIRNWSDYYSPMASQIIVWFNYYYYFFPSLFTKSGGAFNLHRRFCISFSFLCLNTSRPFSYTDSKTHCTQIQRYKHDSGCNKYRIKLILNLTNKHMFFKWHHKTTIIAITAYI